jgi:16S rRNA (uracil1498-N3)-methyltransferase
MGHRFRFFAKFEETSRNLWSIHGEEFFHLRKVLRLAVGDLVEVFDGKGRWTEGAICELNRDDALVRAEAFYEVPPVTSKLVLAFGALAPQTVSELLPCLVELGVDACHIFRHEGLAKARLSEKNLERWEKITLGAAKQCKRAWLPELHIWDSLQDCVDVLQKNCDEICVLHPGADKTLLDLNFKDTKSVGLLLGSEKGLNSEEMAFLKQLHFKEVNLGPRVLRSFTAAITATALMSAKRYAGLGV